MSGKKKIKGLVIVESPKKAKMIGGFLGNNYIVKASMGHVRDLPERAADIPAKVKKEPWANLGVNVDEDFEPLYVVVGDRKKIVKELKDDLKNVEQLIIATDEDREGESIGWHLTQLLQPKVPVSRMVFSEITREAIQRAIDNPRELDMNLISAQETRRVLDRLYGFTLSPLLWKKVKPKLSAGRVQSVAVRLLVQRELERLAFRSGTYWDLKADLQTPKSKDNFSAILHSIDSKRIATGKDFDESTGRIKEGADVVLLEEDAARELQQKLVGAPWKVAEIKTRQETRRPYPPFTTSSMQMEANRKLNSSASQTMSTAQKLYEGGHITYMRTDSVNLSTEALNATRGRVQDQFGDDYLHPQPRQFKTKAKSAQEAHEAIRPAGTEMKTADELGLSGAEARLYRLIWQRTMATQMSDAKLEFQTVKIETENCEFRATGRRVVFPGFFRAYVEHADDPEAALEDQDSPLPALEENQSLDCTEIEAISHETKPPARYTEASLVRVLEENGIGRPSTYASILKTIQKNYVSAVNKQLIPNYTAVAVTQLLEKYFPNLVDPNFTADMEETLDEIAGGEADRLEYLKKFYSGQEGLCEQVKEKEENIDGTESRSLTLEGIMGTVRVGKFGPYIQKEEDGETISASIPEELPPADFNNEKAQELLEQKKAGPAFLGHHPEEGRPVYLAVGRFGPYLMMGEQGDEENRPKTVGIPNNFDPNTLTLDQAVALLNHPRRLGHHPETNKVVNAGIGRFGPYILHDKKYGNFDRKTHLYTSDAGKVYDITTVDLETGIEMLSKAKVRRGAEPLRTIGEHPETGEPVAIFDGRYGAYVKHKKTNATIPKDTAHEELTLAEALELIKEREAKGPKKKKKKAAKKKAAKKTTKKKATKKKATKKTAKKTTAKKKTAKKKATKKKATKKKTDEPAGEE